MELVLYILIKYAAYTLWCYLGVAVLKPVLKNRLGRAFGYGLIRLLMGIFFGIAIFFAALMLSNATRNSILTYLVVYVPVRFIEWLIMAFIIGKGSMKPKPYLWIGGGIVISCLADIPLGILSGDGVVPVGRPFC
ncbi:MAG: hypothetical protein L0229_12440 [Blastocatellia bacterium]|nr:hypothetical protein [Blastocatellia bacterium]